MQFTSEDQKMFEGTVDVMKHMFERLRDMPVEDAIRDIADLDPKTQQRYARKDSKDTRFFDIVAEDMISLGDGCNGHMDHMQRAYSQSGVIITEECGRIPRQIRIDHDTPVIISDPVDSSSYFDYILKTHSAPGDRVGIVFDREVDSVGKAAVKRQACNTSVTLIKDNTIKYTAVMNLMTGDIYVGSPRGVFVGDIRYVKFPEDIKTPLEFADTESLAMICYTREAGKYEDNRNGTHLRFFPLDQTAKMKIGPVGPMRFTQLVRYKDIADSGIGIVAHNGEKIQESLPNIAIALFSNDSLHAYKLFCDPPFTQYTAGRDMTPNLANSLYSNGLLRQTGVKSMFLNNYDYPSEFRDTTAVIVPGNDAALTMFTGMVNRGYAVRIV